MYLGLEVEIPSNVARFNTGHCIFERNKEPILTRVALVSLERAFLATTRKAELPPSKEIPLSSVGGLDPYRSLLGMLMEDEFKSILRIEGIIVESLELFPLSKGYG